MDLFQSTRPRLTILLIATFISLASCLYLTEKSFVAPEVSLLLAFLLIILPLSASLFLYKGRLAYFFFGLALISGLCAGIHLIDISATNNTAQEICTRLDKSYDYIQYGEGINCTGSTEAEGFRINTAYSDFVVPASFILLVCFFLGLLNILLIPIYLVARNIHIRKLPKQKTPSKGSSNVR